MIDEGGIEKLLLHREGVLALLALHIRSGSSERIWPGARGVECFTSFSHPNTWLCLNIKSHIQVRIIVTCGEVVRWETEWGAPVVMGHCMI
jgi:hypothetical protein